MIEGLLIPKIFNTYADSFLLLGLAQIAEDALYRSQQHQTLQLIDAGTHYHIQFSQPIDLNPISQLEYTNFFSLSEGRKLIGHKSQN